MGSLDPLPLGTLAQSPIDSGEADENAVQVLVVGAGPFYNHVVNPSFLIASALPSHLNPPSGPSQPQIRIHAHPAPWRVSYSWIRENVPKMLFDGSPPVSSSMPPTTEPPPATAAAVPTEAPRPDTPQASQEPSSLASERPSRAERPARKRKVPNRPRYDIVLFIGMAVGRPYYTLETRAHRDGYLYPDVDGVTARGHTEWRDAGAPTVLRTGFDCDDVWGRWKRLCADIDVRQSDDAGHFCCDYIYFAGQFEYWRRKAGSAFNSNHPEPSGLAERPVMFLHVPADTDEASVRRGVEAAKGLIRALVASWRARRADAMPGPANEGSEEGREE